MPLIKWPAASFVLSASSAPLHSRDKSVPFGYETSDQKDFKNLSDDVVVKNLKVSKIDALFDPTITLVIGISYFLSIVFGAKLVFNHDITLGQLITFTTYFGMLVWP